MTLLRGNLEQALYDAIKHYKALGLGEIGLVKGWQEVLDASLRGEHITIAERPEWQPDPPAVKHGPL